MHQTKQQRESPYKVGQRIRIIHLEGEGNRYDGKEGIIEHIDGIGAIIAGAGGAAHVAGVTAALTTVPVIGVPIKTSALGGMDSLLSIVQMPGGIPVSTTAINGAKNAALIAASIFALTDKALEERLVAFRKAQTEKVLASEL